MQTVLETWQFVKEASKLFTEEERQDLIDYLARNPLAGDEIVGSGGVRKIRHGLAGRGKSGGARVIYFFYTEEIPLYLITCYGKNTKSDLTRAEINAYAKLTESIKSQVRERRNEQARR
jgi:hypothetical protein